MGDGEWGFAPAGNDNENGCYRACKITPVVHGTAYPVNKTEFWPTMCSFTGTSDTGNQCEIIDGVCVEKFCNADYELVGGICTPCDREFAMEYMPNANCKITNCIAGYHPNTGGLACEPDEIECDAPNAISGRRVWDNKNRPIRPVSRRNANPDSTSRAVHA